jgi:dihydrofolate reductase
MHVSIIVLQTINGFLAKSHDDDLSWATKADRIFFKEKSTEIGTMLMGSTTFNAMKGLKGTAFKGRHTLVFTSKPKKYKNYKNEFAKVEFFSGTPQDAISYLTKQGISKVAVVGGGSLIQQFLASGLVNEIYITIAPYLFGKGIEVCKGEVQGKLKLLNKQMLSENEVLLHYKVL